MTIERGAKVAPVLVLFFNRPANLKLLLDRLVSEGLNNLYFASDGPRNQAEKDALDLSWSMVKEAYPSLESTRFLRRDSNLGCRIAVSEALNWFYSQVDSGIVIEDDCLPSKNFFKVMSNALVELREEERIFCINGTNPLPLSLSDRGAYLSIYPQIWGWATWADRWLYYKRDFSDFSQIVEKVLQNNFVAESRFTQFLFRNVWKSLLRRAGHGEIDTWDYSMLAAMWRNNFYAVQLKGNYIINTGFNDSATHTKVRPGWAPNSFSENLESCFDNLEIDFECDRWLSRNVYRCTFAQIVKNFLNRFIPTKYNKP